MLLQVIVGAILGLVLFVAVVVLVLKRAPVLFVANKLPGNLYGGADDVSDLVDGEGERSEPSERTSGSDHSERHASRADEADVIDRPGATDGDGGDSA